MYHIFLLYSYEHTGWLHFLATINNVVINENLQISLWYIDLEFFGYTPRSLRDTSAFSF